MFTINTSCNITTFRIITREGNGWSYEYCRRQWSLVDNPSLRFKFLNAFAQAMVRLAPEARLLNNPPPFPLNIDETNHVMAFHRGGLVLSLIHICLLTREDSMFMADVASRFRRGYCVEEIS